MLAQSIFSSTPLRHEMAIPFAQAAEASGGHDPASLSAVHAIHAG
jgi:hypothetical protein